MIELGRLRQFGVFIAGGVLSAVVDIGMMQLLIHQGLHHTPAATAGFLAGLGVNYLFHSRVTFARPASGGSFARYLAVVGMNYVLTIGCVALAVHFFDSPLAGKILSLPLVAVNGFLLSRYWIFR